MISYTKTQHYEEINPHVMFGGMKFVANFDTKNNELITPHRL